MTDILVQKIPLPVPHPARAVRFEVTDLPDIYSTPSKSILEKIHEMNVQFYGWSTDQDTSNYIDVMLFLFAMGVLVVVGWIAWIAISLLVSWVVGNKD